MSSYSLQTNILFQAEDFYETFKRCLKQMSYTSSGGEGTIVSIPAIVNGAFALELYFNLLSNEYLISHHLAEIFSHIPEDIKSEIIEKTYHKLLSIYQYEQFAFNDILNDVDYLFVNWRYIFKENKTEAFYGNAINRYIPALRIFLDEISKIAARVYKVT